MYVARANNEAGSGDGRGGGGGHTNEASTAESGTGAGVDAAAAYEFRRSVPVATVGVAVGRDGVAAAAGAELTDSEPD